MANIQSSQATDQEHQRAHQQPDKEAHEGMSGRNMRRCSWKIIRAFYGPITPTLLLGVWLITSPFAFGYQSTGMIWSDVVCGGLIVLFGTLALFRRVWAGWDVCFLGIWLLFAPLVFWAPSAGALSYILEALSEFMGDSRRRRTMPWMVLMFALLVVPLGATNIILVILQPVSIGMWCTLCLIAAVAMLLMVPLAVDEVVAMAQFIVQSRREGKPFWQTF